MKALPYVLAGCIGGLVSSAGAQSLMINASAVGGLQHYYTPGLVATDIQAFATPTPAVSLHDYNAITMTFTAPVGYAWRTENDSMSSLLCSFAYGSQGTSYTDRRWDYRFDFVPGMENSFTGNTPSAWVFDAGFGFDGGFYFAGDFAFTALSITVYGAPGVDSLPLDNFNQASLTFQRSGISPPPGEHVFLVPVPEPRTSALGALAGVVWMGRKNLIRR